MVVPIEYRFLVRVAAGFLLATLTACGGGSGGGSTSGTMTISAAAATPSQIDYQLTAPTSGTYSYLAVYRDGVLLGTHAPPDQLLHDGRVGPGETHCYQAFAVTFPIGNTDSSNVACATTPGPTPGWTIAALGAGQSPTMVADSAGGVHLAYSNGSDIRYRRYSAGAWGQDNVVDSGGRPSLAVDGSDRLHLTYNWTDTQSGLKRVRYAVSDVTGWSLTTITNHLTGTDANGGIAVDANGDTAFAAYMHCPVGCSEYWRTGNASGVWQSIFPAFNEALQPGPRSVAVDGSSNPYFLVLGSLPGSVSVYRNVAGIDTRVFNDAQVASQSGASIHYGSAFGVFAAYWRRLATGWTLVLISRLDAVWIETPVDQTWWVPGSVSAVEDRNGVMHLCYSDANSDLRHASGVGGNWQIAFVDAASTTGDCTIAVDGAGRVHIVYRDFGSGMLKHAIR